MDHLARMEIEWACTKLSHAFSYCLDSRDYGSLVSLFTPDGVWERHGDRLQGRERILEVMRGRPAHQFTRRSEGRRVGKECVSQGRPRWEPCNEKQNKEK